jgi:release factor glutamine methyltransferase
MTVRTALDQGTKLLTEGTVPAPRLTAEVLLAHALRRDRVYLYSYPESELAEVAWLHYGRYLHERLGGKPTQYITKQQEFFGRMFRVCPDVLIPRPETEHLVEVALSRLQPGWTAIDVGTGSGAIAVSLAVESSAIVVATDVSEPALRVARSNASRLGADVSFVCCDLLDALPDASAHLIVSNPPYVGLDEQDGLQQEVRDYEPHVALFGGPTGTEIYRRLIQEARRVLRPGGILALELGYKSLGAVEEMLAGCWTGVRDIADLSGIPRVIVAEYHP